MTSGRNRITELERNVDELESTVRGLTEELVEANQRIRDLEEAMLAQETKTEEPTDAEEAKGEPSEESDTNTGEKRIDDDIIVA